MEHKIPRHKQKIITPEVNALRKMRELRNLSRRQAAPLVERNYKDIEKIENGRVNITPTLIEQFVKAYGYSQKDFVHITNGRLKQIKQKICSHPKIIENNLLRRSYKKIITQEIKTLVTLRKLKDLTQYQAGRLCGYSKPSIGHIENGRIQLSPQRIEHIVNSYGFTMADFNRHLKSDRLITDIMDECIAIIRKLDEDKLKAVHPLLFTFTK